MKTKAIRGTVLTLLIGGVCLIGVNAMGQKRDDNQQDKKDVLVESKRREVRMLDDIYKGGVVVITENYVNDKDTIPAGTAFKQLFLAAEKKGWHRVRLVDATGEPYNDENSPEDDFEKQAVKDLVKGKTWIETIEVRNGVRHLRVATPIPVVFDKCTMCHDNYVDVPKGQAIGALTYVLPIDGELQPANAKAKLRSNDDR